MPADYQALLAIALLLLLFIAFLLERYPPEVTAAGGAAVFILFGLVPTEEVLESFSNPAPITIAAMFVISGSLVRTGLLDKVAHTLVAQAQHRPVITVGLFLLGTMFASAFVNNTPIVLVLIPIVIRLAVSLDLAPTRLLIPLSYAAIMGGTCSLIGTSTNLLVDGVSQDLGLRPFGIFEIAPVGIVVALCGGTVMLVLGRWLLPDRRSFPVAEVTVDSGYLSELTVCAGSSWIGRTVEQVRDLKRPGIRVVGLRVGTGVAYRDVGRHVLRPNDTLTLMINTTELLTLRERRGVILGIRRSIEPSTTGVVVAEAMVAPARHDPGDRIPDLMLGRRFGLRVLGVHRHDHVPGQDLSSVRLRAADKLLMEGPAEGFERLTQSGTLISVSQPGARAYRRRKAPLAILALVMVVLLAALDVMSIDVLGLLAVAAILLLRCIDNDEAWRSIDGSILVLIFSMLIIGAGLTNTGAVDLIVRFVTPLLLDQSPLIVLLTVYVLASVLTELVTNNAVAVVLTPIVVGLAAQLGIDPRPLVVAVMFGASASFASPIGYQTNTLVYGAGAYRFSDFLKIGVPMNIILGLVSVFVIPVFFPF